MEKKTKTEHHVAEPAPEPVVVNTGKSGKGWMALAIILLIALLALAGFGYYQYRKMNQQIKDQQAQITELQNTKKNLEDAAAAAASAATDAAAKAVTNAVTGSDQDQLTSLLKSYCGAQVNGKPTLKSAPKIEIKGVFANVGYQCGDAPNSSGGEAFIFKKSNGQWVMVLRGGHGGYDQEASKFEKELYGIPSEYFAN